MRSRRTQGFTLTELMFVVSIISLLLAIMLPAYARVRAEAQLTGCVQNLRTFGVAYHAFLNDNPQLRTVSNLNNLVPRYLARIPTCPSSGVGPRTSTAGYWLWTTTQAGVTYTFVTCMGAHTGIIPPSRHQYQGPTFSPRTGVNDGRSGQWVF